MSVQNFTEPGYRPSEPVNNWDDEDTPEDKPKTRSGLPSVYDGLRKELSKPIDVDTTVTLKVPGRDRIKVRFSTDLDLSQINRWRQSATNRKTKDVDLITFNTFIIVKQCECLVFEDEDGKDEEGELLNFRHFAVQESLGALDAQGAVKALYERDADILRVGNQIMSACGYDQDEEDLIDPLD